MSNILDEVRREIVSKATEKKQENSKLIVYTVEKLVENKHCLKLNTTHKKIKVFFFSVNCELYSPLLLIEQFRRARRIIIIE
jgi:hypothetical protein